MTLCQLPARLGGLVGRARAVGLGADLDDAGALQFPQPLGEQPTGQARGTVGDLVEGLAADQDVAKDDHRPALAQELRRPGDGAVLPVGPHTYSLPLRYGPA